MRDIDDGDAALLQRADHPVQGLNLAVGDRRRRFVHDKHTRVLPQRSGDLDRLHFRHAKPPHFAAERQVEIEDRQEPPRLAFEGSAVDPAW